ncbi:MAG TPA: CBS domain-containing protein, partial [Acidimicrobiia bacterium]|nr:CBS domain-containing protein [Acidimicrobiia bacterium]
MTDGSSAPTVAELMSTPVITATPNETLADAAARMRERHVGSVVVVQDEKPVGILTERDMIRIAAAGADTGRAPVSEWMTPNPDSVAPGVPAAEAFASLSEHGYRHIPVVDGT